MLVIEARSLGYWYGHHLALNELTLSVGSGITGLVGLNGSGKTTLLRLVSGKLPPTTGSLLVFGEPPWRNPALQQRIGYAPETDLTGERIRARALIELSLRLKGKSRSEAAQIAARVLEEFRADGFADRPYPHLSQGMRQKIKLCVAAAHRPDLLLLDEPFMGLDPAARLEFCDHLSRHAAQGKAVIVSGHVLAEIEQVSSNIVVLHRGRLVAHGRPSEIRSWQDRHPFRIEVRSPRARELAALLLETPGLEEILFPGPKTVLFRTKDAPSLYASLTRCAAERGISIERLDSPDESLQAIFQQVTEA